MTEGKLEQKVENEDREKRNERRKGEENILLQF